MLVRIHQQILMHSQHREGRGIDADWLEDNFHIVEDSLREVRHDLPPGYDLELPKLSVPPLEGYPRVFAIALTLVAHTDSELDEARITRFVQAFQEVAALTIGELWALPTMLRLVLLENLRRLAEQMLWGWNERLRAEMFAAEALASGATSDPISGRISPSLSSPVDPTDPFVVRILQLLRDQGTSASVALERLEAELSARGVEANETLRREHNRQAANQVSVGNCVISLRLLSALDWNTFFETVSRVEAILRADPSGTYPLQDFPTRDRQRRAVESIARRSSANEEEVARTAVTMAHEDGRLGKSRGHIGYYLIDRGIKALKAKYGYTPRWREAVLGWVLDHPRTVYFAAIGLVWLAILIGLGGWAAAGSGLLRPLGVLAILALAIPMSELAVSLVNHLITLFLPPRVLAKLECKEGIPNDCATIVVMPTMLVRPRSAEVLLERLEIHYLANPDPNLRFALLTDFADADEEHRPEDEGYVRDALERVRALNARYAPEGPPRFFLFHRRRKWNPVQGCWMGWERKRGKLSEFNRLLRGASDTSYAALSDDPALLRDIRFVITLDADTQMPRDTARRLVGTIAHPLNQPRFDPAVGRVVEGYGVLQPRVSFPLTAASHSRFAAVLAASGGIDPYSSAASDTYMDLFGLGSFTGKGIYDVDAFEAATGHTFPENQILSHDLIEGNFARCGLLSDTELFDDFPARYHTYARREHRWVRGDWQLMPWLIGAGRGPGDGRQGEDAASPSRRLPALERWKLFDNLRRSLVPPTLVVLLILGWTALPGLAWRWTLVALAVPAVPLIQLVLGTIVGATRSRSLGGFKQWRDRLPATLGQVAMAIAFLADQARNLVDAIARTLYRHCVTRKNMLEWETAATTERRLGTGLAHFFGTMWAAPAIAAAVGALVVLVRPEAIPAAMPVLTAWLFSPLIAFWVSLPRVIERTTLTNGETAELRKVARKTWFFFETFVGEADNWLPPDNFQEEPDGRIAHRTSPTNKGLLLLSTLAAHDLGYIGLPTLVERLEKTFDTFDKLERHWGHFYNWYETRTLKPLPPAYISTVDSGNFLGSLVVLRRGLLELLEAPLVGPQVVAGLNDTRNLAIEAIRSLPNPFADQAQTLLQNVDVFERARQDPPSDPDALEEWLRPLDDWAHRQLSEIRALEEAQGPLPGSSGIWPRLFAADVARLRDDLNADPADLRDRLLRLADRAGAFASAMDFKPLYKADRNLFAIGCNLVQGRLDSSCYDLLASESCLTSLLAIARGDAPRRHWFMLGRPFIRAVGRIGLISWGGTMFEYLMPRLLIKSLRGTLVSQAIETAVARQIEYGLSKGIPWGMSESAFNAQYIDSDYQYLSFGVPGLGIKRGLEKDLVIAPYATMLATMIAPREAVENLARITAEGGSGIYGFYEAIDFTRERVPKGRRSVVVKQYMAHHQGMGLVAIANTVLGDPMPRRFHAEPMVRAVELLLQERVPPDAPLVEPTEVAAPAQLPEIQGLPLMSRRLTTAATPAPRAHLLSNTRYHVMLTNSGSGRSLCRDQAVSRWREDTTRDNWGQFVYLRDPAGGQTWSAGFQPICRQPETYEVVFSSDKAVFRRRDGAIETLMEVTVSPEALAEVRRVTVTNHDSKPREIELTSYAEIVLLTPGADLAHPAFGKLFVETEWVPGSDALICRRRPRSAEQAPSWAVHSVSCDAELTCEIQYETDRARFLGRGRTTADPAALDPGAVLSGTTGPVLDPIVSLRRRVHVAPGASAVVAFTTAVADSREEALSIADQYRESSAAARAFELAWAHCQVEHRENQLSPEDAHLFQRLASPILFAGSVLRANPSIIASNHQSLVGLWRHGISGDFPVVLVRIDDIDQLSLARQCLAAHAYLRQKGLEFDLVLFNEEPSSYLHELHQALLELVRDAGAQDLADKPGGVFVRKAAHAADEDRLLLLAVARVVLVGNRGPLGAQLDRFERTPTFPAPLNPTHEPAHPSGPDREPPQDLAFANGLGGFSRDGREYTIVVRPPAPADIRRNGRPSRETAIHPILPPAPWINVIANPGFGFLVSESGCGYAWAVNSQANRITPWSNDPVADPPGEALYLRDEATGQIWSPTPRPVPSTDVTIVTHGQGYTVFEKNSHGLAHELTLFVPPDDPVKLLRLKVRNLGDSPRRLSATFFAEWVLGTTRDASAMHMVTEIDAETGAMLARNATRAEFNQRVAFADVDRRPRTLSAHRGEFLGRNGNPGSPAALRRIELSGIVGAAIDPCVAIQTKFDLGPDAELEIVFLLGDAENVEAARELLVRYREPGRASACLDQVRAQWDDRLTTVQVRTPDPAMDLLLNRWLINQVLTCRVWARSAFYQSGGAYGFRDQLQDVMALCVAAPQEARAQILRAASRQFLEGDVQHWWHPPTGRGVRTRISDDPIWLPFVASHYAETTGDLAIFEESVPYLRAPVLRSGQEEDYGTPAIAEESAPLFDHCLRAFARAEQFGVHGLPLMGTGDWNDGMNRVGVEGHGESVWLAWFLAAALDRFARVAEARGETAHAETLRSHLPALAQAVEFNAWDGAWYRRAYFDDGTPLGSAVNDECQIDSIAQTWAVISGLGDRDRSAMAMQAVEERLVRREDGVILLFDPPFDNGSLQPGYIKGYVPGIRENGGQYTHAATWVALAFARMGRGQMAHAMFDLINPIRHADSPEAVALYRVEPYVLAGDVYGRPPHTGRGGWTWYTGSASWLYRIGVEEILGFRKSGGRLTIDPCIPPRWAGFEIAYRHGSTLYRIGVENPDGVERGVKWIDIDGQSVDPEVGLPLVDDGRERAVRVVMGRA
ncbi:MAG: cellobiose phosphorylase [Planctomycetota bacterium]|nr:cellobiose phosphorylase [Planctomycetota bacterium]